MTTYVQCDGCEKPIGRPHEALTLHLPFAGLIFHLHDDCYTLVRPKIDAAREAVAAGPEELETLRQEHREQ